MSVTICFINKDGWKLKTESLVDVFRLFFFFLYIRRPEDFDTKNIFHYFLLRK